MKKIAFILSLTSVFLFSDIYTTRVTPRVGKSVWRITRDATPTPIENLDGSGGFIIINTPGSYQLYEDITQQIKIEASNVSLDLNGYNVAGAGIPSIIITADGGDVDGVHVFNGTVAGTGFTGIYVTSFVSSTLSNVLVERISISGTPVGITIDSSANGTISNCSFIDIDAIDNNVGYQASTQAANDSYDLVFQNCRALFCKVRGFTLNKVDRNLLQNCQVNKMAVDKNVDPGDSLRSSAFGLFQSSGNVLQDCQVIEMEAEETVSGFKSNAGSNNLFQNCIVKKINTTAENFGYSSHGFLLTGTEEKTKIIDCVINEVDMTSTVSAISYGIHLEPSLITPSPLSAAVDNGRIAFGKIDDNEISAQKFSPDSKYLALGTIDGSLDGYLRCVLFDGEMVGTITSVQIEGEPVLSVDWSPDGKFIAAGTSGASGGTIYVYGFCGSRLVLIDSWEDSPTNKGTSSVEWSPDGKYIASGWTDGRLRVFNFDGSATKGTFLSQFASGADGKVLTLLTESSEYITFEDPISTTTFTDVKFSALSWSPDGRMIAAGTDEATNSSRGLEGYILVFPFNSTVPTIPIEYHFASSQIDALDWSPNGKVIAFAGVNGTPFYGVLGVDAIEGINYIDFETPSTFNVKSLVWSPDGKYLAMAMNSLIGGHLLPQLSIQSFDGLTLTQVSGAIATDPPTGFDDGEIEAIDWSPCGKYISTGGDTSTALSATPGATLELFSVMYRPENCIIRNCTVCDVSASPFFVGTGIMAAGSSYCFNNVCCNNDVDFSFGVPNVYYGNHNDHHPLDNIATPPTNLAQSTFYQAGSSMEMPIV